jgi:hypothetical protein
MIWKMRALKILLLIVAGLTAMTVLVYLVIIPHPPVDQQLEELFVNQRADFDRLNDMAEEDRHMARIAQDFTWHQDNFAWPRPKAEWGITKERWDKYRALFQKAKVLEGMNRQEKSSDIEFIAWSWGLVTGGVIISYVFCGEPKDGLSHTLFPCIDQKKSGEKEETGQRSRYKQLDGNWYLFEVHY